MIASVSVIAGCLVAVMVDGAECNMGTLNMPNAEYGISPTSHSTISSTASDVKDDIRVLSMLHVVSNRGIDVKVTDVAITEDGDMSIVLGNGDTLVSNGVGQVGGDLKEDSEVPSATSPIYCNSFASILKVIGNIDTTDIESDIEELKKDVANVEGFVMDTQNIVAGYNDKFTAFEQNDKIIEERLKVVEMATGSADITELKTQLSINTETIKDLSLTKVPTISTELSLVSGRVSSLETRVTNVENTVRVVVIK